MEKISENTNTPSTNNSKTPIAPTKIPKPETSATVVDLHGNSEN